MTAQGLKKQKAVLYVRYAKRDIFRWDIMRMKLTEVANDPQLRKGSKYPSKSKFSFRTWMKQWDKEYGLTPIEANHETKK